MTRKTHHNSHAVLPVFLLVRGRSPHADTSESARPPAARRQFCDEMVASSTNIFFDVTRNSCRVASSSHGTPAGSTLSNKPNISSIAMAAANSVRASLIGFFMHLPVVGRITTFCCAGRGVPCVQRLRFLNRNPQKSTEHLIGKPNNCSSQCLARSPESFGPITRRLFSLRKLAAYSARQSTISPAPANGPATRSRQLFLKFSGAIDCAT